MRNEFGGADDRIERLVKGFHSAQACSMSGGEGFALFGAAIYEVARHLRSHLDSFTIDGVWGKIF
jgi:hypothetical protein